MKTILRYENGRAIWSDNVPAHPGSMPIRGSLVVGESEVTRDRAAVARHREKERAQKAPSPLGLDVA